MARRASSCSAANRWSSSDADPCPDSVAANSIAASNAKIAYGTDCGIFPFSRGNLEFQAMVKAGLDPARALRAATGTAAELLDRNDIGVLAPGASADILAMPGDPITSPTTSAEERSAPQSGQEPSAVHTGQTPSRRRYVRVHGGIRYRALGGGEPPYQGETVFPPQSSGARSAMDWVNVQWWPAGSATVYCRSPYG